MATKIRLNRSISVSMPASSNTSMSNSTRRVSSSARHGLHRKRVVVVFAVGEVGDGQPVGARQRGGVDRVVLVDEEGVEQMVLSGDAVNLAERQVLVIERVVVGFCSWSSRSAVVVAAVTLARTGTVLINRPTIESAPKTSAGRPTPSCRRRRRAGRSATSAAAPRRPAAPC